MTPEKRDILKRTCDLACPEHETVEAEQRALIAWIETTSKLIEQSRALIARLDGLLVQRRFGTLDALPQSGRSGRRN
jgi:hypothetical protein